MENLELIQLKEIQGGAIKAGAVAIIAGIGVFIIGVIDGFLRPLKTLRRG